MEMGRFETDQKICNQVLADHCMKMMTMRKYRKTISEDLDQIWMDHQHQFLKLNSEISGRGLQIMKFQSRIFNDKEVTFL